MHVGLTAEGLLRAPASRIPHPHFPTSYSEQHSLAIRPTPPLPKNHPEYRRRGMFLATKMHRKFKISPFFHNRLTRTFDCPFPSFRKCLPFCELQALAFVCWFLYVTQASPELMVLWPQNRKCWFYQRYNFMGYAAVSPMFFSVEQLGEVVCTCF